MSFGTPFFSRGELSTAYCRHRASLPLDELPLFKVEDDRLGRLLAELGRWVQEREFAKREEIHSTGSSMEA